MCLWGWTKCDFSIRSSPNTIHPRALRCAHSVHLVFPSFYFYAHAIPQFDIRTLVHTLTPTLSLFLSRTVFTHNLSPSFPHSPITLTPTTSTNARAHTHSHTHTHPPHTPSYPHPHPPSPLTPTHPFPLTPTHRRTFANRSTWRTSSTFSAPPHSRIACRTRPNSCSAAAPLCRRRPPLPLPHPPHPPHPHLHPHHPHLHHPHRHFHR